MEKSSIQKNVICFFAAMMPLFIDEQRRFNMSMPKYYMFRRPILDSLADGEEHSLKDIARPVAIKLHLTEKEMSEIVSGGEKRYITRIGWGRTALLKAGLIEKTAIGVYKITLTGQKVLADNPPVLDEEYLCKFEGYRKYQYPTK
jgi:restriction system protein